MLCIHPAVRVPCGLWCRPWALPAAVLMVLSLAACSPALNWREVRAATAPLVLMLPCKPDQGSRSVPFAGRDTMLQMLGCDAAGMTFAVAHAEIAPAADAQAVLAQWKQITLTHVRAEGAQESAARVSGATSAAAALPALRVRARGRAPDGAALHTEALYFVQGRRVVQAVLYAKADSHEAREAADTFFAGLKVTAP